MNIDNKQTTSPYARTTYAQTTEGEWSRKRLIRTWLGVLTGLALAALASFGVFVLLFLWGLSTSDWG
jgi:hypothetical protein